MDTWTPKRATYLLAMVEGSDSPVENPCTGFLLPEGLAYLEDSESQPFLMVLKDNVGDPRELIGQEIPLGDSTLMSLDVVRDRLAPKPLQLNEAAEAALGLDEDSDERWKLGGGSDGFWYDLTEGGYFDPKKVLDGPSLARVEEAIRVLKELEEIYTLFTPKF